MLYECDPNKNTECTREMCMFNKLAIQPVCRLTTKEQFAKEGGEKYVLINGKMFSLGEFHDLPTR